MAKYVKTEDRVEPSSYIAEEGTYRFKIVNHEVDGFSNEGNEKHKYTLEANKVIVGKDGKPTLNEEIVLKNAIYTEDEKQYWVFGNLMDALKIAYSFNEPDLVGYYFMADVKSRMYNEKKYFDIDPRSYKYSKMNDALPPVPEAKVEQTQATYDEPSQADLDEAADLF